MSIGASDDIMESMDEEESIGASDDIMEESIGISDEDIIDESIEDEASWASAAVARTAATAVVARRARIIVGSLGSTLGWTGRAAPSLVGWSAARFED
jgi:hypothetical protein